MKIGLHFYELTTGYYWQLGDARLNLEAFNGNVRLGDHGAGTNGDSMTAPRLILSVQQALGCEYVSFSIACMDGVFNTDASISLVHFYLTSIRAEREELHDVNTPTPCPTAGREEGA